MKRILWLVVIASLIPASILAVRRIQAEGSRRTVTIVMDGLALQEQADYLGTDVVELALRYQALGLNGVAIYEETPESLARSGRALALLAHEARAAAALAGHDPAALPAGGTLVSEVEEGALRDLLAKNAPEPERFEFAGRTWYHFPGDSFTTRPAGPDRALLARLAEAGFDIAYRPRNFPNLRDVGADFPAEARYLIHNGLEVAGQPDGLSDLVAASQRYITGIIEGTPQEGMEEISGQVPTVRLLSFSQEYVNRRLLPSDLVDKYLLAADERGIRLLYLRPYTEEQLGNMIENTSELVAGLRSELESEGYEVGPITLPGTAYRTDTLLRALSGLGVLAGLGLLALLYPGSWGPLIAALVLGLGLVAGGFDWDALALVAALVFPVIGYGHLRERLASLGVATLISLAGALLLAAVGSDTEALLAISPFKGVAATLVVPPALFLFHYALRYKRPAQWVRDLWNQPVRLRDVVLTLFAGAALGLVVLRRGNFPIIGASEAELALRSWLADLFVRPRFKELLGHPLAVLGLTSGTWPAWIRAGLLTGGVVAQASILNSFSHYHTPLVVSFQRTVIALVLGLLLGLLLTAAARAAVWLGRRWLEGPAVEGAPAGR